MNFFTLEECFNKDVKMIGGKAGWLGKLLKIPDVSVPSGICISTEYFWEFLSKHDKHDYIDQLIKEVRLSPIKARKNLSSIRKIIIESHLPEEFLKDIEDAISLQGIYLENGVAVRSSSEKEDDFMKAFAGIYHSSINIRDISSLENAILDTWSSQFSEMAFLYNEGSALSGMAVVIQEMVVGSLHGVIFTKAPNQNDCMLLEASKEITNVVDGFNPEISVYINRQNLKCIDIKDKNLKQMEEFQKLAEVAKSIEEYFHMFSDIEWALSEDKVYILQCRPITNYAEEDFDYKIISQDDVDQCSRYYLGPCEKMFHRYLGKQYLFRNKVIKHGFEVYKQYFVIMRRGNISEKLIADITKVFNGVDFVIIELGKKSKTLTCRIEQIQEVLSGFMKEMQEDYLYCRIGEIIKADKSGYASLNMKGECLIEYVPFRMSGLIRGTCAPTQVLIKDGKAEYLTRPVNQMIETIDDRTGKRVRVEYGLPAPLFTGEEIQWLESYTNKLSSDFDNARLEWYISNGKMFGKDISIESKSLGYNSLAKNVLSSGTAEGRAYYIEDLEELDEIAETYNLSLYAHSKAEDMVVFDEKVQNMILNLIKAGDAIILADRPSVGILSIADYVKGCVFRQGAVLSHVGICLREKEKVAIISPESFGVIKHGDQIRISDSGLAKL